MPLHRNASFIHATNMPWTPAAVDAAIQALEYPGQGDTDLALMKLISSNGNGERLEATGKTNKVINAIVLYLLDRVKQI